MKELKLKVDVREEKGRQTKKLRREEKIPGIIYGHNFKNKNISVDYHDFCDLFEKAGESSLIDLIMGKAKPIKVIVQDIQLDPVSNKIIHVDFHTVKMTEKITTEINLNFVGEAPAVKELGGVLIRNMDKLEIECLPADLIQEIDVNLSVLKTFEDIIYVRDLELPEKITLLEKEDEVVAKVQKPRSEEELEALEEEVEEKVEEVEGVAEEEDEEEGEEGEEKKPTSDKGSADKEAKKESSEKKDKKGKKE
ncbi:MAG: 50S ribosomal protein L25 [Patescibacteria group bacterium]|nr:50S ribosomal protein L25 [Patescibacteria group bacterium]